MRFTDEQTKSLAAPLHKENVKRNQRGFDYVESWHAEAEANRIFGFDGWSSVLLDCKCVLQKARKLSSGDGYAVTYIASVRITAGGVQRDGAGAGHGMDKDLGLAHESALKEAASDAEKRALKTFGNQFGLALYDKTRENVIAAPVDDRRVVNPATGRMVNPQSANQARKDGRGERAAILANEIDDLVEVTEALAWKTKHEPEVGKWPPKWQDHLWEKWNLRVDDLRKLATMENGVDEDGVIQTSNHAADWPGHAA